MRKGSVITVLSLVLTSCFASGCADEHVQPPGEPASVEHHAIAFDVPEAIAEDSRTPSRGCGRSANVAAADLSWVHSSAKLYRLDSDGKFSVGGFDGRPWKELAHHPANSIGGSLLQSDDRRWIAYHAGESDLTSALWLYDTRQQAERHVAVTQKYFTGDPEFSPDGLTLAYFSSYDDRWTGQQGMGLYLVDTQSGRNTFAGYPAGSKIGPPEGFGSIQWTADGGAVLIHLVGHPGGVFTREFHRFDTKSGIYRRMDGNYDKTILNGEVFMDGGRQIPTHIPRLWSTRAWYGGLLSISGSWRAYVDDKHRLWVRRANERELLVVAGRYDNCEGVTVGITGWVDGDKYLVYRNENRQFIFDPVTQRRSLLLEDSASVHVW
ncbi:MAG TPA: hypothetical protein VFV88_04875 [Steroidobacteraceae bacterium]|nr:hypothetical protein [Steroidobacteraceae bacterium]